ncbi:acyl carrier protein, partial [Bradyrhizobium nitroreducens]
LLEGEGFAPAADPARSAHALGQQILVAISNGIVRQTRAVLKPAPAAKPLKVSHEPSVSKASKRVGAIQLPLVPVTGNARIELQVKLQTALSDAVSECLKIEHDSIDIDTELSEFGFDSITLTGFGNQLNDRYGLELSPTVFFEHPTIEKLAAHLVQA